MRLLIGGSPCTHWSIAQTKNRETEPSGIGWELFRNYVVALKKYQPDYFLYENNKSMAAAIREQITRELGVEPVLINSALVSAQNRQRLYWVGKRNPDGTYSRVEVGQPEDRGIILRDILESSLPMREKGYTLKANYAKAAAVNGVVGNHFPAPMKAEPVNITDQGKSKCLRATYYKDGIRNMVGNTVDRKTCVAEPFRVCNINGGGQGNRIYSADAKSCAIKAQGGGLGGHGQGLYAVPAQAGDIPNIDGTAIFQNPRGFNKGGVKYEKSPTLTANGDWQHNNFLIEAADGKTYQAYEVRDGLIAIKGKQYPIKLADGYYIIRKLTVRECMRLQTVPDSYIFPVSDTQAYKMLGNGWTVDVIAHIMGHFEGILEEPVEVLSMYDGMSCGRIALDKLGANVIRYYATEIDKYAIQTTMANYPDTVQLGDAFQVLADDWTDKVPRRPEDQKVGGVRADHHIGGQNGDHHQEPGERLGDRAADGAAGGRWAGEVHPAEREAADKPSSKGGGSD